MPNPAMAIASSARFMNRCMIAAARSRWYADSTSNFGPRSSIRSARAHLLVAHPGHELLLYGWIIQTRPVVHVLTDGSGAACPSRLGATAGFLADGGATPGSVFGPLTDRAAYAILLDRDRDALMSLVTRLADDLIRD